MNAISIDLTHKLPQGLTELYSCIEGSAQALGIETLIVGAMARDIVLVHGFGARIERGTRDVDFGINVRTWHDFDNLKARLLDKGFTADRNQAHKLHRIDSTGAPWEVDIIPFGPVAGDNQTILWPPDNAVAMSVLGFQEALEHAWVVAIKDEPEFSCNVATPAGVCLLKLIAWTERDRQTRKKDASDLLYLMATYHCIPDVENALYEEGYAEANNWDMTLASAMKLGSDTGAIAQQGTARYITESLIHKPQVMADLTNDMIRQSPDSNGQVELILNTFVATLT